MIASQISVILSPSCTPAEIGDVIADALAKAARPVGIRFAVPASALEASLPQNTMLYTAPDALEGVLPLLRSETHFLLLGGPYRFEKHWDAKLLSLLRSLGPDALLTGSLSPGGQPCLPALKESPGEGRVSIGRGLPLVCAEEPQQTLLIDPAFLMGPAAFLRTDAPTTQLLSLKAYLSGYTVYALHRGLLYPTRELPRRELARPAQDPTPGTSAARFEQLLGFRDGVYQPSGKASMGLFTPADTYPQSMPKAALLKQKAREVRVRRNGAPLPLMISAFVELPRQRMSTAFYRLRFGFLKAVESLPVALYTAGEQERSLRACFPRCLSYPGARLFPSSIHPENLSPEETLARGKPLLMHRAAQRQPEFTHAAWVDMSILPHPICPEAVPDCRPVMDHAIHIALVGGKADTSFFVMPVTLLAAVVREIISITQFDIDLKRKFDEQKLWERLMRQRPDWFVVHPMPEKGLLFLSLFDETLLSVRLRELLSDVPKPIPLNDLPIIDKEPDAP